MKKFPDIKRILITRTDKLGDTILALPVASDVKKRFPNTIIDILCNPAWADLAKCDASVEDVITWKKSMPIEELLEKIKEKKYDAVLVLHSRPGSLVRCMKDAQIKIRVGSGRRFRSFLFTHREYTSRRRGGLHECDFNRQIGKRFLKIFGEKLDIHKERPHWNMSFSEEDKKWVDNLLDSFSLKGPYGVIQPGSDDSSPNWPIDYVAKFLDEQAKLKRPVLVHVGPGEERILDELEKLCEEPVLGVKDASLTQLGCLIKAASVMISNSTGPLHLASAVETPIVGIYPPILRLLPQRWGPLSFPSEILMPPLPNGKPYRKRHMVSDDCMYGVSVEDVCSAFEKLWKLNSQ